MDTQTALISLGWKPSYQQQQSIDELDTTRPVRVIAQHRSRLACSNGLELIDLDVSDAMPAITVGDWLLLNHQQQFMRLLDRHSLFSRKAAGSKLQIQLIAANVDTLFIVSSLNQDFNLNRIERYLALAYEADVEPIVVLTKQDQCDNADDYISQMQAIDSQLMVIAVNALDKSSVEQLQPWCYRGNTVAFMGSSGVGKSTLVNSLAGSHSQQTSAIREDDSKGRHTTTGRVLQQLASGAMLMDTPGMRELQLADCEQGLEEAFQDIQQLSRHCKFADCLHQNEPGCAVKRAIDQDNLDERRLSNYLKLKSEQAFNSASLAEKREADKSFTRSIKQVQSTNRRNKKNR